MDNVDGKLIFTTSNENQTTNTTESYTLADSRHGGEPQASPSSPLTLADRRQGGEPQASPFSLSVGKDLFSMAGQQEPRAAETASNATELEEAMNLRLNNALLFNDMDHNNMDYLNHFMGLSSADNYISTLTREQLSWLHCIQPRLLYVLEEVAIIRSDMGV